MKRLKRLKRKLLHGMMTGCFATLGVLAAGANAQPNDKAPDKAPTVNPKAIWPAGLEVLEGRYTFMQVASPGGLWERGPGTPPRQIALPDCPKELQDIVAKAEVVISDLVKPTEIAAEERLSPSKRGNLRFYREDAKGKLAVKSLPGIGGVGGDKGQFNGTVEFSLNHQSHSNPSAIGILEQRKRQEPTWGAAALDFADLTASLPEVEGKEGDDLPPVLANARVLRSGVEIFAFLEWEGNGPRGRRTYQGSVRLAKKNSDAPPARPDPNGRLKEVARAR